MLDPLLRDRQASSSDADDQDQVPSRYRVLLLPDAKPTERGVLYRRGSERFLLAWSRVHRAFAAEVGEGEPRSTVFDLAVRVTGPECVVCRIETPAGEEAVRVARAVQLAIGEAACSPCILSLANDGIASRTFPDRDVFAEAALESVRFG